MLNAHIIPLCYAICGFSIRTPRGSIGLGKLYKKYGSIPDLNWRKGEIR